MTKRKKVLSLTGGILLLLLIGVFSFAKVKKVSPLSWNAHDSINNYSGIAIKGYDPVAYFQNGKAVEGNQNFSTQWQNSVWRFSSQEYLEAFAANPTQYAPQFGGYCSFAVSNGFTANIDPTAWHIENGKLYLFDSQEMKTNWLEELDNGVIQKCEENWKD